MKRWKIRVSPAASSDISNVLQWTLVQFGETQAQKYRDLIRAALVQIADNPRGPLTHSREKVYPGHALFIFHGREDLHATSSSTGF